ncbi:MAG TPA: excalibur calcium-binding domain-containing protein [Conexibacter sp.]|nr:excalibur calcium-binding domain-containing protein [Conexibacter sp.]
MRRGRWTLVLVAVGGLIVGTAIGASGEKTKTTTDTQTVVETQTVPVEHVRTVVKIRRVVRTQTLTVDVPVADGGGGSSGSYDAGSGSGSGSGSADQYAGMNCAEIGHSFTVTPGSDPEHDRDNDGIACESYPP